MDHCLYCEMDGPHAAQCVTHHEPSPAGACDCGQKWSAGKARAWRAMGWLQELAAAGRVFIETALPADPEWRMPDGLPWTLRLATNNAGLGTAEDELGEDEWLTFGGGSLVDAVETAWLDIQPTPDWAAAIGDQERT